MAFLELFTRTDDFAQVGSSRRSHSRVLSPGFKVGFSILDSVRMIGWASRRGSRPFQVLNWPYIRLRSVPDWWFSGCWRCRAWYIEKKSSCDVDRSWAVYRSFGCIFGSFDRDIVWCWLSGAFLTSDWGRLVLVRCLWRIYDVSIDVLAGLPLSFSWILRGKVTVCHVDV